LVHTRITIEGWIVSHPGAAIACVIGLILGGFTHTVADIIGSFWKKVW
jgi:uncharacterized metal-binding protein